MRQFLLLLLTFVLAGCQALPVDIPTVIATVPPTAILTSIPSPTPDSVQPVPPDGWQVHFHPGEVLYVGDQVSFEVFTTQQTLIETKSVTVSLAGNPRTEVGSAEFGGFGIANRRQATLTWVWNTASLSAGDFDLVFDVQPAGPVFTQTLTLLPYVELPPLEAVAVWAEARSACCVVHYLTHTEAERDLPTLLGAIDKEAIGAAGRMGVGFSEPVTITLMPRLLGHGGFADNAIHVSYLDRNAVGGEAMLVIHHEMVHILDSRLGGDLRPSILVEGLAVYLSGGHFKPEPLLPRAAVLLEAYGQPSTAGLDRYIPLRKLAANFYASQHEIGYLEAGALVAYLVERWGWTGFNKFYRDIHPVEDGGQEVALDRALRRQFGMTLEDLESDFLAALAAQPAEPFWREDVRLTVLHFDTLRRYQQDLDQAAYFLTAWLVNEEEMRARGITADYLRRPSAPLNVTIELLLNASSQALIDGRLEVADDLLVRVNAVLEAVEAGENYPAAVDGMAFAVFERVGWLARRGMDPQTLRIEGDWLVFGVRQGDVDLTVIRLPIRY